MFKANNETNILEKLVKAWMEVKMLTLKWLFVDKNTPIWLNEKNSARNWPKFLQIDVLDLFSIIINIS